MAQTNFRSRFVLAGLVLSAASSTAVLAQTAPPTGTAPWQAQGRPSVTGSTPVKAASKPAAAKPIAEQAKAAPDPKPTVTAQPAAAQAGGFQTVDQLQKAGVKRCLQTAQAVGQASMTGSAQYAAASTWNNKQPDNRFSVSMIGQQYAAGQNTMPNGLSGVFSVPTAEGRCDAAAMQIIPTTDPCATVQAQVLTKGKALGNLAGVSLLQNAANAQVMLLPGANNSCVLVVLSTVYTE